MSTPAAAGNGPDLTLKIVMAGESGVGKTNLMSRFTQNRFDEENRTTIGAEFGVHVVPYTYRNADGKEVTKQVRVQVWDTAGQERYRAVSRAYFRDAVGCVLVYTINSRSSLRALESWVQEVRVNGNKDPVLALVGNKSDLADRRKVDAAQAAEFALRETMPVVAEVSAKTGAGVEDLFTRLVAAILQRKPALLNDEEQRRAREEEAKNTVKLAAAATNSKNGAGGKGGTRDRDEDVKGDCC